MDLVRSSIWISKNKDMLVKILHNGSLLQYNIVIDYDPPTAGVLVGDLMAISCWLVIDATTVEYLPMPCTLWCD